MQCKLSKIFCDLLHVVQSLNHTLDVEHLQSLLLRSSWYPYKAVAPQLNILLNQLAQLISLCKLKQQAFSSCSSTASTIYEKKNIWASQNKMLNKMRNQRKVSNSTREKKSHYKTTLFWHAGNKRRVPAGKTQKLGIAVCVWGQLGIPAVHPVRIRIGVKLVNQFCSTPNPWVDHYQLPNVVCSILHKNKSSKMAPYCCIGYSLSLWRELHIYLVITIQII